MRPSTEDIDYSARRFVRTVRAPAFIRDPHGAGASIYSMILDYVMLYYVLLYAVILFFALSVPELRGLPVSGT